MDRILEDVGSGAGNLPLLEFCLAELWSWSGDGKLSHVAYEAIGRVDGALANHAEGIYEELDAEMTDGIKRAMLKLVQPGRGTEDTKRLATRDELGSELWPNVQVLAGAEARLVIVDRDEVGGQETAEIIHEAIIQNWSRLQEGIDEDRAFLTWQEQLRFALEQWEAIERDEGALLRGVPLDRAKIWLDERENDLGLAERGFIRASIILREQEQRREKESRRNRLILKIINQEEGWQDLCKADLRGANLRGANLRGVDLRLADLEGAHLEGAHLGWTILIGANLSRADLEWADLREANLSEANLSKANLSEAFYDNKTRWPQLLDLTSTGAILLRSEEEE